MPAISSILVALVAIPLISLPLLRLRRSAKRRNRIQPTRERVLILGASAGVGQSIAVQYAQRGALVCIVGRREAALDAVRKECDAASEIHGYSPRTISVEADFSKAEDMVLLRQRLEKEWEGLDTLHVVAGVSALRPFLETAGVERPTQASEFADASVEGVHECVRIASLAVQGNIIGPIVAAVSFIPLLTRTSPKPAVLLVSSVASVIPAPTRALYASTKGASLLLYQSLAIEHPEIAFSFVLPGTVEGNFRTSAVDAGTVRESDPNASGLKRDYVACRCIHAVDNGERTVFLGYIYRFAHLLYWICPGLIERMARKKYNFSIPQ